MSNLGRVVRRAPKRRSFAGRAHRPAVDWHTPVDGRAPRLGPREYIGLDTRGRGAWADRDPMVTPAWWSRYRWGALVGWAALTAGTGWWSWRKHGGKAFLFGSSERE